MRSNRGRASWNPVAGVWTALVVLAAVGCLGVVRAHAGPAEQQQCQARLLKELPKLDKALLNDIGKCLDAQRKGKVDPLVDCVVADAKGKQAKAVAKFQSLVERDCGPVAPADFSALGFGRGACAPVTSAAGLAACLVADHQARVEEMLRAVAGNFDASVELAEKVEQKCQSAFIKLATKGVPTRQKGLGKCLASGDATTCGAKLDKAFAKGDKLLGKVDKACRTVKAAELIDGLGLTACGGEGGAGGVAACAAAELACLSDAGLALGMPLARAVLDQAGRQDVALCAGVPAGVDVFQTTAQVDVEIVDPFVPGGCSEQLELVGPTAVQRGSQVGDVIDTEIVAMELTGFSVCLGQNVALQLNPAEPSAGQIQNVQLDRRGNLVAADSFFDVFARIQPDSFPPVVNPLPFHMGSAINGLPPQPPDNVFTSSGPQQLVLESNPLVVVGDVSQVEHEIDTDVCCDLKSFTKSGDSYDDSGGTSHKKIKFTFMVKDGEDPKECVLVNWLQGSMKNGDGGFFMVTSYGVKSDFNFPTKGVDSVDTDPAYWSDGSGRWNYTPENATTASATDDPGPALSSEKGAVYAVKFEMCVYCIDDVPATAPQSGAGIGTAKACIPWEYSVVVGDDGKFSHPALP